ncbi:hypothetical protein HY500_01035 [Candidatus Woesearchaeota archaeon]|nr:hypothetical protein [Candidatus Woesearchaeota archaeon]
MKAKSPVLLIIAILLSLTIVFAHGPSEEEESGLQKILDWSLSLVYINSGLLIIVTIFSIIKYKTLTNLQKNIAFWLIITTVVITTIFIVGSTLYLNAVSPTRGPVHWHADFTIEVCGKNIEIADPTNIITNRIGKSDLHEHNDMRIHIEGTPPSLEAIDLSSFFEALGGTFTDSGFSAPTTGGFTIVNNHDLCNNKPGKLLLFVEGQEGIQRVWRIEQKMGEYIIAGYAKVPPGDRLKIIFTDEDPNTILAKLQEDKHGS